jgi:hypothetical protein
MHDAIYGRLLAWPVHLDIFLTVGLYEAVSGNYIVVSCRPHDLSIRKNDALGFVDMLLIPFLFSRSIVMKTENIYLQCTQF